MLGSQSDPSELCDKVQQMRDGVNGDPSEPRLGCPKLKYVESTWKYCGSWKHSPRDHILKLVVERPQAQTCINLDLKSKRSLHREFWWFFAPKHDQLSSVGNTLALPLCTSHMCKLLVSFAPALDARYWEGDLLAEDRPGWVLHFVNDSEPCLLCGHILHNFANMNKYIYIWHISNYR